MLRELGILFTEDENGFRQSNVHLVQFCGVWCLMFNDGSLFFPMFSDFGKSTAFWKVPTCRLFVLLVRATWR